MQSERHPKSGSTERCFHRNLRERAPTGRPAADEREWRNRSLTKGRHDRPASLTFEPLHFVRWQSSGTRAIFAERGDQRRTDRKTGDEAAIHDVDPREPSPHRRGPVALLRRVARSQRKDFTSALLRPGRIGPRQRTASLIPMATRYSTDYCCQPPPSAR